MKLVHKLAFALVALFAFGTASAVPMTDTHVRNPDVRIGGSDPAFYTFTHSFLDGLDPFVAGFDTIGSATLTIRLQDNGNSQGGTETFRFVVGPAGFTEVVYSGANQDNPPHDYINGLTTSLAKLSETGVLDVTILADTGSFRFMSSILDIDVTRGEVEVELPPEEIPEPFTLALMGLGLAGMAGARRRK